MMMLRIFPLMIKTMLFHQVTAFKLNGYPLQKFAERQKIVQTAGFQNLRKGSQSVFEIFFNHYV
jgi:hypothetical protein